MSPTPGPPEEVTGLSSGLSSPTTNVPTTVLSCHCLACPGEPLTALTYTEPCASLRQPQALSPAWQELGHGPGTRGCLLNEQGVSDESARGRLWAARTCLVPCS